MKLTDRRDHTSRVSIGRRLDRRGGLIVRPMRRRDLGAVMAIERQSYPRPWTEHTFRGELERVRDGGRLYLAATSSRQLAGYAGLLFAADDAHVTNIAVEPSHRRRGVARRLLAELALAAHRRGSAALTLEVRVTNAAAQALYAEFGFEVAGTRPRYYENTDDALVMWRHGVDDPSFADQISAMCPEAGR